MAKSDPIGVRFDPELLEELKKDYAVQSPQWALNFLTDFYKEHRPPKSEKVKTAKKGVEKVSNKPLSSNPPPGLKGIDLSIWKAEQKASKKP